MPAYSSGKHQRGTSGLNAKGGFYMFGIFKKKSEKQRLEEAYKRLLDESYQLSHRDRKASDAKALEAEELRKRIDALPE